ncbi:MAG: hypothetical protein C4526_01455 [Nitrospiraceae bacterium]|nr:MAG: hypothetical protein C4526_01455 [Nitrospiraceae bacterium]
MKRKLFTAFFLVTVALIGLMFFKTDRIYSQQTGAATSGEAGCLKCHEGIEPIADTPVMSQLACTQCHMGNPDGATKDDAHKGMYANPADLRVVDKTCGVCHAEDVSNSKKSMHATMAGMIGGTRYDWAAQDTKNSLYATYDVEDKDGNVPEKKGAVKSLRQLPLYDASKPMGKDNHPSDDYLRDQCLRCHLWSKGAQQDGDYRASGCAACHVVYSDNGLYEGSDRAIDKNQKGRPKLHKITTKIPSNQCLHCHNRGGRTGVSYIGTMESDEYGSPWSDEAGKKGGKKLHGKFYNHLTADIHYQKGMTCTDCHTIQDLHGDGNIYNKKWQAVEIECEDCHGSAKTYSGLKSSWGNTLNNLRKDGDKIILTSKMDGKKRVVPQTKDIVSKGSPLAKTAMGISAHMNKMECYACHAKWAPQCYGCHAQQDTKTQSGDWINTKPGDDLSKAGNMEAKQKTTYKWSETRSYLRWESPVLGWNSEGKVSPYIPGCQVVFTQIGQDGKATMLNKVFTTYDGFSGIAHNPIQPHTIAKEARACEDCHANRKTIGLGGGIYNPKANGVDIPFELERIVDENGKQLQATNHYGARPFNKEEQDRIMRVNVCVSCHDAQKDAEIWKKVTDVTGFAKTDAKHMELLKTIFKKGTGK